MNKVLNVEVSDTTKAKVKYNGWLQNIFSNFIGNNLLYQNNFCMDRAAMLERLEEEKEWDIIIIGGGATGLAPL